MLFQKINDLYDSKITGDQLIILNEEVKSFTDICGACERIKTLSPILGAFLKNSFSFM
jgi:putative membrane protein